MRTVRDLAVPDDPEGHTPGGVIAPVDATELQRFTDHYYESGSPERASEALETLCLTPDAPAPTVAYLFGRIALDHPEALRDFEDLFSQPQLTNWGRLIVLGTLQHAGDERTIEFLSSCLQRDVPIRVG